MVDNVNLYYNFKPRGDHEYTSIGFKLTISMSFVYSIFSRVNFRKAAKDGLQCKSNTETYPPWEIV